MTAYLLGEVAGDDRKRIEDHVAACPACREEVALLSRAAEALRDGPAVESMLGPAGRERILAAARTGAGAGASPVAPGRRPLFYWAAGLAAAALVAFGVMPWGSFRSRRVEEPARITTALTEAPRELAYLEQNLEVVPPVELGKAAEPSQGWSYETRQVTGQPGGRGGDTVDLAAAYKDAAGKPIEDLRKLEVAKSDAYGLNFGTPVAQAPEQAANRFFFAAGEDKLLALHESLTLPTGERSGLQDSRAADWGRDGVQVTEEVLLRRTEQPASETARETSLAYDVAARRKLSEVEQLAADGDAARPFLKRRYAGLDKGGPPAAGAAPATPAPVPPAAEGRAAAEGELALAPAQRGVIAARARLAPAPVPMPPAGTPAEAAPAAGGLPAIATGPAPALTAAGTTTASPPAPAIDWKARVDDFLTRLDRKPGETPDMMFFRFWGDNPFVEAASDPQSTFGADADTASYALARSYLYKPGTLPPREAVRTEEFINYFSSRYAPPAEEGRAFAIHCEVAPSPFGHDPEYRFLKVGLKGREVPREKRKAASLVFVVDTSGSMRRENRLELVKDALRLLVPELDEGDAIGIVAFDAEARTVLEPAPASEKERLLDAISRLEPRQNTNVAAGLELGFQMAAAHRLKDGTNRVILLSDGVANTGITDAQAMLGRVRVQREQGIYLTCVGVGMGNHNDALLEELADRGNGQCVYVDRLEEARKVFVEDLTATLEPIARDVKIQVEFNPARVIRYRLLGYENRAIADALFRDNKVDAGEVGAGHEVAALYELKLQGPSPLPSPAGQPAPEKLATVRVRHMTIEHGEAIEIARDVTGAEARASFAEAAPRFRLSACVAEFAEVLRESYHARGSGLDRVAAIVEGMLDAPDGDGRRLGDDKDVVELTALLKRADALVRERERQLTEVARTAEALKENYYLRAQVEDAVRIRRAENRVQLDEILLQNDALRRRLEGLLAAPR